MRSDRAARSDPCSTFQSGGDARRIASEVGMQVDESATRLAHECADSVSGNEISAIRDVVHVDVDAPKRCLVAQQRVHNHIRWNRIDIGGVAVALVLVIHTQAGAEAGNAGDVEAIGRPQVSQEIRCSLWMMAHRCHTLWVFGDESILASCINQNVPLLVRAASTEASALRVF